MIYTDRIHIIADSLEELHKFANEIGLSYCWFDSTSSHPHYDFPKKSSKGIWRDELIKKAIKHGAVEYPSMFSMWKAREERNAR